MKSGQKLNAYANIGNVADVEAMLKKDVGGIDLFRSGFLYLGNNEFLTEEQQFVVYKQVEENMAGKSDYSHSGYRSRQAGGLQA